MTGLTNGTLYYFLVAAVNTGGESPASITINTTPTNGITIALAPGIAAMATLQASATTSLTYTFPATAVSANAIATVGPLVLAALPAPLIHSTDTFVGAFSLSLNPSTLTAFNAPVGISGSTGSSIPPNTTLNLAVLQNNAWADMATLIVGASGSLTQNLTSITLPGLLAPGTYLLYEPTPGTSTAVSNLGIALIGDGGFGMADGSNGLQVIHLYNAAGSLLSTPTIAYFDYPGMPYLNSQALTPDASQGVILDTSGPNRYFSNVQTGTAAASSATGDITGGVSIAMLPTGDEAVISINAANQLLVLSGIVTGKPVTATTIPILSQRDSLVLSADAKVLLARGNTGLSVFSVTPITPKPGSNGGTVSHAYTQIIDFPNLGSISSYFEDGHSGMAMSPIDSSRAVVIQAGSLGATIQLMTNLASATPLAGVPVQFPTNSFPYSVAISLDGKLAIFGTLQGMEMYSGVDTGTLTRVGTTYRPLYKLGLNFVTLGAIATLGITLDGKYVIAGDMTNRSIVVIPFTSAGFAAKPASALGSVTISAPYLEDQIVIH